MAQEATRMATAEAISDGLAGRKSIIRPIVVFMHNLWLHTPGICLYITLLGIVDLRRSLRSRRAGSGAFILGKKVCRLRGNGLVYPVQCHDERRKGRPVLREAVISLSYL